MAEDYNINLNINLDSKFSKTKAGKAYAAVKPHMKALQAEAKARKTLLEKSKYSSFAPENRKEFLKLYEGGIKRKEKVEKMKAQSEKLAARNAKLAEAAALKEQYSKQAGRYGLTVGNFKHAMSRENLEMTKDGKIYDARKKKIISQSQAMARLTKASTRFRMELLSVMFFGYAVSKVFGAMTAGSLEAAGTMEVLGVTTMLIGLPAAMKMTSVSLGLLKAYSGLSDGTKEALSWTLFFGQGLFSLLGAIGAVGLGLIGLKMAMPSLFIQGGLLGSGGAIATMAPILGTVVGILGTIFVAVLGIWKIFDGWGTAALTVGKGIMWLLIGIAGIVALILGAPVALVAALVAFGAGAVWVLAQWKPVGDFFAWLGNLLMAIVGATTGLFTGGLSGMAAGWKGGWNVPKMAGGGIVTRPTLAMIGESGPEAVVPLGQGGGMGMTFAPTININNPVLNTRQDINDLGRRINEILYGELRRLGIR